MVTGTVTLLPDDTLNKPLLVHLLIRHKIIQSPTDPLDTALEPIRKVRILALGLLTGPLDLSEGVDQINFLEDC